MKADMEMRKRNLLTLFPLGLSLATLAGVWLIGRPAGLQTGFPLDDSWIHMVYGSGLASEGRFAYNPGISSTGSTAPLWTLCVALSHLLFRSISVDAVVVGLLLIGSVFHLMCVWLTTELTARITRHWLPALAAGVLLAVSPPMAVGALSGMEISLCALLLVAAVRSLAQERWATAGIWLALAPAARPESAGVSVICFLLVAYHVLRSTPKSAPSVLMKLSLPSVAVAALIGGHNLLVSGRPLPATFYFKHSSSLAELPGRLRVAVMELLNQVPPFWGWAAWLSLAGFITRSLNLRTILPLAAGVGFLLSNLLVAHPDDPPAFYHLRYVLPAVPLLVTALCTGAHLLGRHLSDRREWIPAAVLLAAGLMGSAFTLAPVSRHYNSDVRNINEVQVALGKWLAGHTEPDAWIAASDAGAVRYHSRRPTVDVMGLNTPEFYWNRGDFIERHPVDALALMPAWFRSLNPGKLRVYASMETKGYTVTSNPYMAKQLALGCVGGSERVRLQFKGLRSFSIDCRPRRLMLF